MYIALDIFCFSVPFMIPFAAVLSVATGVGGCGWPISARAVRMSVAFCKFSESPPNSASVAYCMTFLRILHYTCTGPFLGGIDVIGVLFMYLGLRGKNPPDLLRASGSDI